jgi:hypothetical protein
MTTYTTEALAQFPWIVSCDTLKTEHLLVRYWEALEQVHRCRYDGSPFAANQPTLTQQLEQIAGPDAKEADWDEEIAAQHVDKMREILEEFAPDGFYFGSQEGDGACFGFWLDQDWADLLEHCGFASDSDPAVVAAVVRDLLASGVDTDNYEDAYQGEAEGYNEAEAGAEFAAQLAEETGMIQATSHWPHTCIDWEEAWRELELGDSFWLQKINGFQWAVFRNV